MGEPTSDPAAGSAPTGVSPSELAELFPFAIQFDAGLRVAHAGPSIQRSIPEIRPGVLGADHFVLERPSVPLRTGALDAFDRSMLLLRHLRTGMQLKGQLLKRDGGYLFLGSPWVTSQGQVSAYGLTLGDFADAVAEVLAGNGFRVLVTDEATPTPAISFSVTAKGAVAGANLLVLGGLLVIFALFMRRGIVGAFYEIRDRRRAPAR